MKPVTRPAVLGDFLKIYGTPPDYRVRAIAGEVGGEVIAVGGIAFLPNGSHVAFLRADDKARQFPMALHKAGLFIIKEARRLGIKRLVAYAEDGIEAAERWLKRLGFEPAEYDGQEVWVWEQR
jgi:hypothetical protein